MIPILWQVAFDKKTPLIDAYSALLNFKQYFSDGVHPNQAGADSIASVICKALTGPPQLLISDTVVACTVSTGRTGLTAARYTSICNTAYTPVLDSVTVSGAAEWLSLSSATIDRNHQKIGLSIDASKAPQVVKTYTDTLTLTATNAQPSSHKVYVKLTVRQGTNVIQVLRSDFRPRVEISLRPAHGGPEAIVSIPKQGRFTLDLFDLRGRLLASAVVDGAAPRRIGLPALPSPVCLARITDASVSRIFTVTMNR